MANKVQVIFEIDKDAQGRTTLKQLESGITRLGRTAQGIGPQIDAAMSFAKGLILVEFFRRGAQAAFDFAATAVKAFNDANNAALGLQSVARFKGLDAAETTEVVRNLDLVKTGLLSIGDASTTVKNLLQAGFSLEQSIDLIKRFGDSAAFGRQGALSFGQAVVSTSEGIRNQNSILSDNGGITKNLSVILKERGFELQDLSDKVKGAAAREALYNGLLAETQAQVGDAAKLTTTFAGEQAKLEAAQQKLLVTLGELITKNPELGKAMQSVGATLEYITQQLKDSDSELSKFVKNSVTNFAILLDAAAKLARGINAIAAAINFVSGPIGDLLNPGARIFGQSKEQTDKDADVKVQFTKLREAYAVEQKKLEAQLKQSPILNPEATSAGQKITAEINKANDAYFRKVEESNKKFAEGIREISNATADLQSKLSINPVATAFDAADASRRAFIERLRDVPREFKDAFEKASRDAQALDLFKGVLGQGQALINTRRQLAELEAGGDPQRLAQARREAIQQEIDQAKRFLDIAANPAQRQLAIGRIVEATNNISELTPEQRDVRFRALNEQVTVQEQLFRENFNRLTAQTNATNDNTAALVQVGNRLTQVEGALSNFKEGAIIKIVNESPNAVVDLGSG
jgi:hypothetical protein